MFFRYFLIIVKCLIDIFSESKKKIKTLDYSLSSLGSYIEREKYKGFDPYDGLESSIFKLLLKSSKYLRFLSQQLIKRFPINVRPFLFIKKGYNPVTLGLYIQSYSYLYEMIK